MPDERCSQVAPKFVVRKTMEPLWPFAAQNAIPGAGSASLYAVNPLESDDVVHVPPAFVVRDTTLRLPHASPRSSSQNSTSVTSKMPGPAAASNQVSPPSS